MLWTAGMRRELACIPREEEEEISGRFIGGFAAAAASLSLNSLARGLRCACSSRPSRCPSLPSTAASAACPGPASRASHVRCHVRSKPAALRALNPGLRYTVRTCVPNKLLLASLLVVLRYTCAGTFWHDEYTCVLPAYRTWRCGTTRCWFVHVDKAGVRSCRRPGTKVAAPAAGRMEWNALTPAPSSTHPPRTLL